LSCGQGTSSPPRCDIIAGSWTFSNEDTDNPGQSIVDSFQYFSLEAALTGQTMLFSSGDSDYTGGGTDLSAKMVPSPTDLPNVTSVGGTSVAIGRTGRRLGEWGWGWENAYSVLSEDGTSWEAPAYSSGGGPSQLLAQPFYQKGVVPSQITDA
jgi:subtilase family serine protease